ncbi:MAG TPA: glycoside hydrolase family 97 N-terminal domain-containing protein, partial [Candidatus Barnesiella merdigallinarum]|nr:glycoside hydrolase family 97 N-terminal domain-containing protein [Candidatus Barnesiella merdigallinarum]
MKTRLTYGLLIVAGVMSGIAPAWGEQVLGESISPNDSIKLVVLDDNDALYYKVVKGTATLIEKSALGIVTSVGDFSSGVGDLAFTDRLVEDPYELPSGKRSRYENTYKEATVT